MNLIKDDKIKYFPGILSASKVEVVCSNESFKLKLGQITSDDIPFLESSYDWSKMMHLVLDQLEILGEHLYQMNVVEDFEIPLNDWLHSFSGWGLAFLLLSDAEKHQEVILHAYQHVLEDNP